MQYFYFMSKETGVDPFTADILVEQMEWEKASSPQTIGTVGLGPCIGITLYNSQTKSGFVGHFVDPRGESIYVEEMVTEALAKTNPNKITAWVRGGSIDPETDDVNLCKATRNFVSTMLTQLGITKTDIQWTQSSQNVVDLILDCKTGKFYSFEDEY
jgi:chemotaxis receptor (MCP) glutamine deamidase CheD